VPASPIDCAIGFWKPKVDQAELQQLADYQDPQGPRSPGINAWRTDAEPRPFRVIDGARSFALYAAVHPIEEVPQSAEALAEIRDWSGNPFSYVLWFPDDGSVVVPFDPNAAVQAFWREEYVQPDKRTVLPASLLSLYYAAKPVVPASVRSGMRKFMARRASSGEQLLEWPADDSLDSLQRLLMRLMLLGSGRNSMEFAWFWPNRHQWAAILTHDVETASGLAKVLDVAEIERQRGFRSSFNLVPMDYEIPGSLLSDLREGGFEIGVHGYKHDGLLFSSWPIFMQRMVTINECGRQWNASGFRSPATYRNTEWFHLIGFEYDSSITDTARFEPQPGGCASVFPFALDHLVELPMTMPQDHTLFELLGQSDPDVWLDKLKRIRLAHGMACMLTHPDPQRGYIGLAENEAHYVTLLDTIADSDAWVPLPRDLAKWWRARTATRPEHAASIEGMSFGTAALNSSGEVEIVPPAR